ncbi:MAG: response regulator transcription factor [Myxococcales bacterium]|nr:response regulator transcription factor [Myxococcales bacterium]
MVDAGRRRHLRRGVAARRGARMLSVFIADDHDVVRTGLRLLVEAQPDMRVVGDAGTAAEALRELDAARPDVLVLDLSLPDAVGVETVEVVRKRWPRLPILILTMYPEDQLALGLLAAGASAYLNKARSSREVLEAIRRLGAGRRYVTETLSELALDSPTEGLPHSRLSAREFQTFILLVKGRSSSAIAHELGIKYSTASTHIARIKEKLGVDSVAEIVRYAHRVGLLR